MTRQPLCRSTPSDRLYMLRGCSCALQRKPHLQRDGYTHTHTHTILNQHSQDRYRKRSWASRRVEATDSTLQHHRRRQQHTAHLVSPDYSKIKWGASIREAPEIEATQSTSVLLRDKGWDANPRPPLSTQNYVAIKTHKWRKRMFRRISERRVPSQRHDRLTDSSPLAAASIHWQVNKCKNNYLACERATMHWP